MTHSHKSFLRRVTPLTTSTDVTLDDYLNTYLASDGPTDADNESDTSPLAVSARAFHCKVHEAQQTDPRSPHPDPALWDRIIAASDSQRKDTTMSSAPLSINPPPASVSSSVSTYPTRPRHHSRLGRVANVLAAVSLVLLIGAGYWFSGYGPGGPGGNDQPRYAAQIVSPAASPEDSAGGCTVEPLTTEDVMAIVRNPLNPLDAMGVTIAASPAPLLEVYSPGVGGLPEPGMETSRPTDQEFLAISEATTTYYDCLLSGTNYQMWALVAPHVVQTWILANFPVFRDEADIGEWIDKFGPQAATVHFPGMNPLAEYTDGNYRIGPNPDALDPMIVDIGRPQDPRTVWIGTQVVQEGDGEIVSQTTVRANGARVGASGEVLMLMQWPGADAWYVAGTTSIKWTN